MPPSAFATRDYGPASDRPPGGVSLANGERQRGFAAGGPVPAERREIVVVQARKLIGHHHSDGVQHTAVPGSTAVDRGWHVGQHKPTHMSHSGDLTAPTTITPTKRPSQQGFSEQAILRDAPST